MDVHLEIYSSMSQDLRFEELRFIEMDYSKRPQRTQTSPEVFEADLVLCPHKDVSFNAFQFLSVVTIVLETRREMKAKRCM